MHREFVEENYLETIYILYLEKNAVKNIDVSDRLGVARATVTHMIKKLVNKGYLEYRNRLITLTPKGETLAKKLYEKHMYLTSMLMYMGIDKLTAEREACQIEHVISEDSFQKIRLYFNN